MEKKTVDKVNSLAMTDEALERYDHDGSGLIEFEEFVKMFIANAPPFSSKLPKLVVGELESMRYLC